MVWIVGLIPLAVVVGLAVWVYDPAYRRAWRARHQPEPPQARRTLQDRTVSEPPVS
ncbi:hypothetical protein [Geminicoccus harenae]|uniref:hypothetical protein n=1 Tax=Geminicoccus harenae TaxID=2498453 RepID=UPI00168BA539|nr:hypothetical protein [Geminicoccus harenae]